MSKIRNVRAIWDYFFQDEFILVVWHHSRSADFKGFPSEERAINYVKNYVPYNEQQNYQLYKRTHDHGAIKQTTKPTAGSEGVE